MKSHHCHLLDNVFTFILPITFSNIQSAGLIPATSLTDSPEMCCIMVGRPLLSQAVEYVQQHNNNNELHKGHIRNSHSPLQ